MNRPFTWPRRGLYLLTPDESSTTRLLARVRPLFGVGVSLLQYRNKVAGAGLRREQASALQGLCREHGVPLMINDDWRLAAELGAEGAHLGAEDGELREARQALGPQAILGASCYDELARAERAIASGADYVAFGAFFASDTKPLARRANLALLQAARALPVPRVAIGGIRPDNAPSLLAAGADLLAVISAIFDADDPVASARQFISCFEPSIA